jgi:hypothetical protein
VEAAEGELLWKRGRFHAQGGDLVVSVGFREMFTPKLQRRLRSGFNTTVVMRVYLYKKAGGPPLILTVCSLRAVYDLWEEQFIIQTQDEHRTRVLRLKDQKKVVDKLTSLWQFPVIELAKLELHAPYFIAIIAEVNPMSEELLTEVRRWLRNPYGGHRRSSGQSFFGSFVSIFVNNKIRRAEKTFRVRTQPYYRQE